jgi:hypothetical protein
MKGGDSVGAGNRPREMFSSFCWRSSRLAVSLASASSAVFAALFLAAIWLRMSSMWACESA